ncbi:hypothetical protein [Amaricoccus macauensis]|uniref:hypothetical protein n=1 Tax=Amaricoccus macauensis TaxID=57001 RepID=UPI003C7AF119
MHSHPVSPRTLERAPDRIYPHGSGVVFALLGSLTALLVTMGALATGLGTPEALALYLLGSPLATAFWVFTLLQLAERKQVRRPAPPRGWSARSDLTRRVRRV